MVLDKHQIESALRNEHREIAAGRLKEDNPLDQSEDFWTLCEACRKGDLKTCQEMITTGVNINARDRFDYTPLILASLCGHYEVVQLLLDSGALCERDTFQGERCLYNALNDRIRNLLLSYDYSKSSDPLQPLAGHITSLLGRQIPKTWDLTLVCDQESIRVHKFILAARSPYFAKKLAVAPDAMSWRLPNSVPPEALKAVIRFLYFAEPSTDFGEGEEEREILRGIERLSRMLEIDRLFDPMIIDSGDRRVNRQRRSDEVSRGREELQKWFRNNIIQNRIHIEMIKAETVKWDRNNGIYADVLLRADEDILEDELDDYAEPQHSRRTEGPPGEIPIGPFSQSTSRSPSRTRGQARQSVLYPAHRAMLLRSDFFATMFSSAFREAQETQFLQIVPIDCSPAVLEVVLSYLYTERCSFGLDLSVDVLFAADLLFIDRLKVMAATTIGTLGNGPVHQAVSHEQSEDAINIYEVLRAGWITRMHRLEEFAARYIAYRLERYIDEDEFIELVRESAGRIRERQATDTIELIDDIRFYLSERFRLRFEEAGLEDMMYEASDADLAVKRPAAHSVELNGADLADKPIYATEFEGVVRTLDGAEVSDEFAQDAINYQILLGKIDRLLDRLRLDA